jgi:hypothetical protein
MLSEEKSNENYNVKLAEEMKRCSELLKEFGLQVFAYSPGVQATPIGKEAFKKSMSFDADEWRWLKPLLEELRDFRREPE